MLVAAAGEAEALDRLADLCAELASDRLATEGRELAARVREGRFYVACVGQFKRGKSTLLDALIGEPILPTGVVPVTAVPTVVRYGPACGTRIRTLDGDWQAVDPGGLREYVCEEHNPENVKAIDGVEVFVPSPLLASGMCLIDTPGLGSVFLGNTASTHAFVPHIDAAIVVLGTDPPITGEELGLVASVARQVQDLIFVINKSDRVTDAERAAATDFSKRVLEERLQRRVDRMYCVSAVERLEGRGPARDWDRLLSALEELTDRSGSSLVRHAAQRGLQRLGEQALSIIEEERTALLRPLEESEQRIATLRQTIGEAERSMNELGYLFTAEQHRLSDRFLARRKGFVAAASPIAKSALRTFIAHIRRQWGPAYRRNLLREAQLIARKHIDPWLEAEEEQGEAAYRQTARRFVDLANEFLARLAAAGVPELAQMPHALDGERGFRVKSSFYFHDFIEVAQPASVFRYIADVVLGFVSPPSIQEAALDFLGRLLEVNSARVQNDVNARVIDSRQRLEADIRILLREVSHVAGRALEHARAARAVGSAGVSAALARLDAIEGHVRKCISVSSGGYGDLRSPGRE